MEMLYHNSAQVKYDAERLDLRAVARHLEVSHGPRTTPGSCRDHSGTDRFEQHVSAVQLFCKSLSSGGNIAFHWIGVLSSTRNSCWIPRHFDSSCADPGYRVRACRLQSGETLRAGKLLPRLCNCWLRDRVSGTCCIAALCWPDHLCCDPFQLGIF